MQKRIGQIWTGDHLPILLLILGFVEFLVVAIINLGADSDSKSTFLFGYSAFRLGVFLVTILIALGLLFIAFSRKFRIGFVRFIDSLAKTVPQAIYLVLFLLLVLSAIIWLIPFEVLGRYGQVFDRIRLVLFMVCFYPVQFSIYWMKAKTLQLERGLTRPFLAGLGLLIGILSFILSTGLGITPENKSWNPAGTPVTGLQLSIVLFFGLTIFGVNGIVKQGRENDRRIFFDILIALSLYLVAFFAWMAVPNPYNEFSTKLIAPYYQAFPSSDAAVHDIGGLSILNGSGILLGEYTDKPLYMVFLAILHLFAGFDYNLITLIQVGVLALMIPGLYYFGKSFHSRLFGFVIASIVLLRQFNAISLTKTLYFIITPRQLMTEVPTLLGLIAFSWVLFECVRGKQEDWLRVFVAGVVLGAVTLIRLNPFLLILAVPIFLFFSSKRQKKIWLKQSLFFLMGCAIVISPWVLTGKDPTGNPYFLVKFLDVINVRYKTNGNLLFPGEKGYPFSSTLQNETTPLAAGISPSLISIDKFPGFVINYTLNNFVGAFLILPDSIQRNDQNLDALVKRPYWLEGKYELTPGQIPFLALNLLLISLGLGWSWRRWSWAGLAPLFVFVVYSISLGLGRTSGSRYLPPIDWVVNFYFVIGLLGVFLFLPQSLRLLFDQEFDYSPSLDGFGSSRQPKWISIGLISAVVFVSGLIPAAQLFVPCQTPICKSENVGNIQQVLASKQELGKFRLVFGQVLYPQVKKDQLAFELITCKKHNYYEINGIHEKIASGETLLFGFATEGDNPDLLFVANPPKDGEAPLIIWKRP